MGKKKGRKTYQKQKKTRFVDPVGSCGCPGDRVLSHPCVP